MRGTLQAGAAVTVLRGIGPKRAEGLKEAGVATVDDLLLHLPVRYEDRSRFLPLDQVAASGPPVSVEATVETVRLIHTRRKGFRIVRARVTDESGHLDVVWYNQPYLKQHLPPGRKLILYGRPLADRNGGTVLQNPEIELPAAGDDPGIHTGRIVPVHRRLPGLSPRMIRALIHDALRRIEGLRRRDLLEAVHFPPPGTDPGLLARFATPAWLELAYDELFRLQLRLGLDRARYRAGRRGGPAVALPAPGRLFPFRFTAAQQRVAGEIGADLASPVPMARLLQGDVGSGKTAVAVLAMRAVAEAGRQAALMAPTSLLAEQHHRSIGQVLDGVELLTGATPAAERRTLLRGIATGEVRLVVGTHALLEPSVRFADLGLAVVDEQHRFGVLQRAALAGKGSRPDLLVMTATPIPRTVAMTVYGDLDVSVIDELPPGRKPVRTLVRSGADRPRVIRGIRETVRRGGQVYVVAPRVEEDGRVKSATGLARRFREEDFPDLSVGLLHGRLSETAKLDVIQRFRSGEISILVATTVVEVGLDVPSAAVMVVEDADRFGLAQLHQLRGRVGRGGGKATCILMTGDGPARPDAEERLAIIAGSNDGFEVAERDLELRGPGALLGVEQHGAGDLWFLRQAVARPDLLAKAREEARSVLEGPGGRKKAEAILAG